MAQNPVRDPQGDLKDALMFISDYFYRKEFGLSQEEFEDEPLEVYLINQEIMNVISDIQRTERKKLERQSKR